MYHLLINSTWHNSVFHLYKCISWIHLAKCDLLTPCIDTQFCFMKQEKEGTRHRCIIGVTMEINDVRQSTRIVASYEFIRNASLAMEDIICMDNNPYINERLYPWNSYAIANSFNVALLLQRGLYALMFDVAYYSNSH